MKQLLTPILDELTFRDLAGKRQPRVFTVMAAAILVLLLMTGGLAIMQRYLMMQPVQAMAVPVVTTQDGTVVTEEPVMETTPVTCPTDPTEWSLTDPVIQTTYKTIQPACVYAGLERTIAWALAVRSGYSRREAAQLLGFAQLPMKRLDQVTIQTETRGLQDIPVSFIPPHPDLIEWRVDANGDPALAYGLRGCFRTSSVVGNRLETWGGNFPVICLVVEDAENTYTVYALDGYIYTSPAIPTRSYLLFGYAGENLWIWLGTQESPKVQIENPGLAAEERSTLAALYDSRPWDIKWLVSYTGMARQPLPENWRGRTDEAESQAVLGLLNAYVQESSQ